MATARISSNLYWIELKNNFNLYNTSNFISSNIISLKPYTAFPVCIFSICLEIKITIYSSHCQSHINWYRNSPCLFLILIRFLCWRGRPLNVLKISSSLSFMYLLKNRFTHFFYNFAFVTTSFPLNFSTRRILFVLTSQLLDKINMYNFVLSSNKSVQM